MPAKIILTDSEIKWILETAPKTNKTHCATILKQHVGVITRILKENNIKMPDKYAIAKNNFLNPETPEVAYILGLLWADGSILNGSKNHKSNTINLTLKTSDFVDIKNTLLKTGEWHITIKKAKIDSRNNSECHKAVITNEEIHAFLKSHDYHIKSGASACKILSAIPEQLRHYWWRGYFDGDGSVSSNKRTGRLSFTSCFEQDWEFAKKMSAELGISCKIYLWDKSTRFSSVYFTRKLDVLKLNKFLYGGDTMGFSRKRNKMNEIKNEIYSYAMLKSSKYKNIFRTIRHGINGYMASVYHEKKNHMKFFINEADAVLHRNSLYLKFNIQNSDLEQEELLILSQPEV